LKVFIGPIDVAGQAGTLARAFRSLDVEAVSLSLTNPREFPVDRAFARDSVPANGTRRVLAQAQIALQLGRYILQQRADVYHFLMLKTFGGDRHIDLPLLRRVGRRMLMEVCGDEVRIPEIAVANNPFLAEYYRNHRDEALFYRTYGGSTKKLVDRIRRVARHIRVATAADYELYPYVAPYFERVELVRQVADLDLLQPAYPDPERTVPVVLHAPSKRHNKGTAFVEAAVAELRRRGVAFDFRMPTGLLAQHQAWDLMRAADVVVDQLIIGSHGGQAVEAMALGKPVICYIRDDLVERYPADMPIVNANPDTLADRLEALIAAPELRHDLGRRGRRYVEQYHDSRKIAQQLLGIYAGI
jgi:glycosyltransferase involved in cell wall biosynthesis